jgi:hypothetical protein
MTTETPPDWVLLEAAKLADEPDIEIQWLRDLHSVSGSFRALCDMIQKYEKPPVDRKVLCAQEAWRLHDEDLDSVTISVHAIELYEEGFGK